MRAHCNNPAGAHFSSYSTLPAHVQLSSAALPSVSASMGLGTKAGRTSNGAASVPPPSCASGTTATNITSSSSRDCTLASSSQPPSASSAHRAPHADARAGAQQLQQQQPDAWLHALLQQALCSAGAGIDTGSSHAVQQVQQHAAAQPHAAAAAAVQAQQQLLLLQVLCGAGAGIGTSSSHAHAHPACSNLPLSLPNPHAHPQDHSSSDAHAVLQGTAVPHGLLAPHIQPGVSEGGCGGMQNPTQRGNSASSSSSGGSHFATPTGAYALLLLL